MQNIQFNDATEVFIGAGKQDNKGREIGYIVGLRDNDSEFYAWVQNARKLHGEFKEFGVPQRSKKFTTQAAATAWAYTTAKQRISKL